VRKTSRHFPRTFNSLAFAIHPLAFVVSLGLGCVLPASAQAQTGAAAQVNQQFEFDLPAGSLSERLLHISRTAGVIITLDATLVDGKSAAAVRGKMSGEQALQAALIGTGLELTKGNVGYQLRPLQNKGVMQTVRVNADTLDTATEGTGAYTISAMNTATKLNLSVRQTPQSVTVISRQQIEDQGLDDLNSLAQQIPGVNYNQADSERFSFYARGFDISAFQVDGVQVSSHPDGAYQPFYRSGMDMVIYDHIEVVKGATGLTIGAGSPAASINLVRKRPTHEFQASVEGSVGSWDAYRTTADISAPLNDSGSLRGRLVGAYEDKEHFIDYYQSEQSSLYGIVEADITEATLLAVSVSHSDNDIKGMSWGGAFPAFYSDGTRTHFSRSFSQVDDWASWSAQSTSTQVELVHHVNDDWQVKVIYNDQKNKSELFSIFYDGYPDPDGYALLFRDEYPNTIDRKVVTADVNGKFDLWGREQDLMLGYTQTKTHYYGDNYLDWDGYETPDFVQAAGNIPQLDHSVRVLDETLLANINEKAVYGALRLRPLDNLAIITGVRISDWSYDGDSIRGTTTKAIVYDFDQVVSPYLGAVYDLNKNLSVYASYTDIFTPQNAKNENGDLIDPVDGNAYELGIKGEFNGGKVNASAAVFKITQDNLAESTGKIIAGQPVFIALEGATSTGVEVEVSGEVLTDWKIHGGISHSKIEDAHNKPVLTSSAENTFKVFTTYRLPQVSKRLLIGGGISWQSDTYKDKVGPNRDKVAGTADDRLAQGSYGLVDLMANYKITHKLSASLNINNLFDKQYITAFRQGSQYGLPRNAKLTVKYSF